MAVFPGSYVQTNMLSSQRANHIIDNILTPGLLSFRQITIYDEQSVLLNDNRTWKNTFNNWNQTFNSIFRYNGRKIDIPNNVNYKMGTFQLNDLVNMGDNVYLTYNFDYFPAEIIYGFMLQVVDTINTAAYGTPTSYGFENCPLNWNGVIADLTFARCMEKLILDYDLWSGKVVFALGYMDDASGGDIVGQLETLKRNAEDRAYKTLENEKFKNPNYLARPTDIYYNSVRSPFNYNGKAGTGRLRGMKINRWR